MRFSIGFKSVAGKGNRILVFLCFLPRGYAQIIWETGEVTGENVGKRMSYARQGDSGRNGMICGCHAEGGILQGEWEVCVYFCDHEAK